MPRNCSTLRVVSLTCLLCLLGSPVTADDWPQWRGPNRDGVWHEQGVVEEFDSAELSRKWSVPIASGYSGPTVADGRVFVMDREVEPEQTERVLCFSWEDGKPLWQLTYPCPYDNVSYTAGPRASVTCDGDFVYALGTMGDLHCLSADKGDIAWKRQLVKEYKAELPGWGIAASPLIYGDLVIVQVGGANEACLVALDKQDGTERWRALDDRASYSSPILIQQGGQDVLVCWTGDHVAGLNPKTGDVYWQHPFKPTRMVIGIATPVVEAQRLFVSSFYDGSLMLQLGRDDQTAEQVWRRLGPDEQNTDSLHAMIGTPYLEGDYVYGVDSYGELRCLDAKTGDRLWESLDATPKHRWSTIHMVRNGDRMWMFNERGELIIARLSPKGFEEISRAKLLDPSTVQLNRRDGVCWSHPAYAYKHVFARNDNELVCADLSAK